MSSLMEMRRTLLVGEAILEEEEVLEEAEEVEPPEEALRVANMGLKVWLPRVEAKL